jgi:hypothetical protein
VLEISGLMTTANCDKAGRHMPAAVTATKLVLYSVLVKAKLQRYSLLKRVFAVLSQNLMMHQ